MGLNIDATIDVTDYLDENDLVEYLEERGWSCKKVGYDFHEEYNQINGVSINFGIYLKDIDLSKSINEAFIKHGYNLTEKIAQL